MKPLSTTFLISVLCLSGCGAGGWTGAASTHHQSLRPVTAWLNAEKMDVAVEVGITLEVRGPLASSGSNALHDSRPRLRHRLMLLLADTTPEDYRGTEALDKLSKRIAKVLYDELGGPHSGWGITVLFDEIMFYERGRRLPRSPWGW